MFAGDLRVSVSSLDSDQYSVNGMPEIETNLEQVLLDAVGAHVRPTGTLNGYSLHELLLKLGLDLCVPDRDP